MKKLLLILLFSLMSVSAASAQDRVPRLPDFSDLNRPLLRLPFTAVDYSEYEEDGAKMQVSRFSQSVSQVRSVLKKAIQKKELVGGFYVLSETSQPNQQYTYTFALNNEHHIVTLHPDGSGSKVVFKARADSIRLATTLLALYGYQLPGGTVILVGEQGYSCD